MSINVGEDIQELDPSVDLSNDWGSDDLDFSSDFEVESIRVEDGGVRFNPQDSLHANCVDRQTYEKEKQAWEDAMDGLSQRFSRATSMLDNMKTIALKDQERIEELEKENKEVMQYKETFERLQQQIEGLNTLLYESNEEGAAYRQQINELKDKVVELEDKLYGPTNYYYQEFLRVWISYSLSLVSRGNPIARKGTRFV